MTDPTRSLDPPSDATWPVSVKGVLLDRGRVLLARNDRSEWELPGGRLEPGEDLATAVRREFAEETGLDVHVGRLLHAATFEVVAGRHVVVIAYACATAKTAELRVSSEHEALAYHDVGELGSLPLPDCYRVAIATAVDTASRLP